MPTDSNRDARPVAGLAALARPGGAFAMLAIDQRESLRTLLVDAGHGGTDADLATFKVAVARQLSPVASGILVDRDYGLEAIVGAGALAPSCGLIVAVDRFMQAPGGPLEWSELDRPALTDALVEAGAVALKFLVVWRPGDPVEPRRVLVADFIAGCRRLGLCSVLEGLIQVPDPTDLDAVDRAILAAAHEFAPFEPDLYKTHAPTFGAGEPGRDHGAECGRLGGHRSPVGGAVGRRAGRSLPGGRRGGGPWWRLGLPRRSGRVGAGDPDRRPCRRARRRRTAPARGPRRDRRRDGAAVDGRRTDAGMTRPEPSAAVVLGIDIGTTNSKAVACLADGTVIAQARRTHDVSQPAPGHFEHDAEAIWWGDTVALCRELVEAVGDAGRIRAVAVTTCGPCLVPVDANGRALRPGILYGVDTRASDEVAAMDERIGREAIRRRTGMPLSSQSIGPKIAWVHRHEPDVARRTTRWHTATSFIVERLTGAAVIDHHQAAYFGPFTDAGRRTWDVQDADGLDLAARLPDRAWPGDIAGTVTPAASEATGLRAGTAVLVGTSDGPMEALAVGVTDGRAVAITHGSTTTLTTFARPTGESQGLWLTDGWSPEQPCLGAGLSASGALVAWSERLLGADGTAADADALRREAAASPPGARGLLVVPSFAGERTPVDDPAARGVIAGLTLAHTRGDLHRAILEGIAFGVRQLLEAFAAAGIHPVELASGRWWHRRRPGHAHHRRRDRPTTARRGTVRRCGRRRGSAGSASHRWGHGPRLVPAGSHRGSGSGGGGRVRRALRAVPPTGRRHAPDGPCTRRGRPLMRAVVLHGPDDLRLDDVDEPALPDGGLLVRPVAVGICGSDVRTWRHGSPRLRGPQVLGHEVAAIVVESDVPEVRPGSPVAICPGAPCLDCRACRAGHANLCRRRRVLGYDLPGGMAERMAVPSDWIRTGGVVTLDPAAPVDRGALIEPLHTVINGQDQVAIGPGDVVLVLGLGPIGVLHAAHARSTGATVLGVDPDTERVARAATLAGGATLDRMDDGWVDRARAIAGGGGFDVVIVAVGDPAAIRTAIELVEPGGRVLAFAGLPPAAREVAVDMNDLHYRQLGIVGSFGGTPDTFRRAAAWLDAHPIDPATFAPERFGLEAYVEAFEAAAAGRGLKTLLQPTAFDRD